MHLFQCYIHQNERTDLNWQLRVHRLGLLPHGVWGDAMFISKHSSRLWCGGATTCVTSMLHFIFPYMEGYSGCSVFDSSNWEKQNLSDAMRE